MKKLLITTKLADKGVEVLKKHFDVQIIPKIPKQELLKIIPEIEILLVRSETTVDKEILDVEAATSAKLIDSAVISTGAKQYLQIGVSLLTFAIASSMFLIDKESPREHFVVPLFSVLLGVILFIIGIGKLESDDLNKKRRSEFMYRTRMTNMQSYNHNLMGGGNEPSTTEHNKSIFDEKDWIFYLQSEKISFDSWIVSLSIMLVVYFISMEWSSMIHYFVLPFAFIICLFLTGALTSIFKKYQYDKLVDEIFLKEISAEEIGRKYREIAHYKIRSQILSWLLYQWKKRKDGKKNNA